jgi:hypothetical protein
VVFRSSRQPRQIQTTSPTGRDDALLADMPGSKGKGRGHPDEPVDNAESAVSTILKSAVGLATSALAAPPSHELNGLHATASAVSSKISPLTSANEYGGSSRISAKSTGLVDSGVREQQPSSSLLSDTEQHTARVEADFAAFLEGGDPFAQAPDPDSLLQPSSAGYDALAGTADASRLPALTVAQQEAIDGAEVTAMLCTPSTWDSHDELAVHTSDRPVLEAMSPAQHAVWRERLARDGHAPKTLHCGVPFEHPLNFAPPAGLNEAERERFLHDFHALLTSYTDEVWGDLKPLVHASLKEMDDLRTAQLRDPDPGRTRALRRLWAVMGHLAKPEPPGTQRGRNARQE